MTNQELLDEYKRIVPFLSQVCGTGCEILLHDLTNTTQSVVAIENGFHSGRSIGSPVTDLAKQIIESGDHRNRDFMSNYSGLGKGKPFISSTFYIKNGDTLIGLLCINRDTGATFALENALSQLISQFNLGLPSSEITENLDPSVDSILRNLIASAVKEICPSPEHMSRQDKERIIGKLSHQEITKMKGAVREISRQLDISEATVYRYIKSAKREE